MIANKVKQSNITRGTWCKENIRYKYTHMIKDIQAGYLVSSYFKDIYLYLAQNKLPSVKSAIRKIEALAEKYILLDSLLFKIILTQEKETAVLAIMEICADKIITLYHLSLFAGHRGVIDIFNYKWQILYTQLDTLFTIIHKRLSHMPTHMQ